MGEQEIPENYPRCRFCDEPMGDGGSVLEENVYGPLYVCGPCCALINSIIEDSLPELMRVIMNKAEKPLRERLDIFDYENWEKYIKKQKGAGK